MPTPIAVGRHVCKRARPDPSHHGSGFSLIQVNRATPHEATLAPMVGFDWAYVLSLAASLALAIGAMCVLLFAMY